jgi:hypothetical protein
LLLGTAAERELFKSRLHGQTRSPAAAAPFQGTGHRAGGCAQDLGEYHIGIPQIGTVLATFGHVVSPVDAVPEALLGPFGVAEGAAVIVACHRDLAESCDRLFLAWRADHGCPTTGHSVTVGWTLDDRQQLM